jgi:hypothetical protein
MHAKQDVREYEPVTAMVQRRAMKLPHPLRIFTISLRSARRLAPLPRCTCECRVLPPMQAY